MKKLYLCLFLFQLIAFSASAELYRGYIITLNGYHLTGQIGEIYLNEDQKHVVFVNDFGTPYMISPRLIAGFAYEIDKELVTYQSIVVNKSWAFLKVLAQGEGLKLLKTPEVEIEITYDEMGLNTQTLRGNRYYLQLKRERPVKVKRWGFRKQMRQLFQDRAPELAEKIGEKGYRFKNLKKIAKEYIDEYEITRFIM
ncbi:MAG TPA: hypothetical protein VJ953_02275 [Saprospiraceae bacterium]|nr:hypothetical protein [Saprospiraceae bacterium]